MQTLQTYTLNIDKDLQSDELKSGLYIAVLHATRVPPHIGLIIDQHYHSLNIKGQDNAGLEALIRNIKQREIPSLFIKIKSHPIFSQTYLREHFLTDLSQYSKVDIGIATCLSPVKAFFEEVFTVDTKEINYLYQLLPKLEQEGMIEQIRSLFIDKETYQLPLYTGKEITEGIKNAREEISRIQQ